MAPVGSDNFDLRRVESRCLAVKGWPELERLLADIVAEMDVDFYALTWRVGRDTPTSPQPLMLALQNYPPAWIRKWRELVIQGKQDPVLKAAEDSSIPFLWADLDRFDVMDPAAIEYMRTAREAGLGNGLTIPLHTSSGAAGACHFAMRTGRSLPKHDNLIIVGLLACNAAHRLSRASPPHQVRRSALRLTPRQVECTTLAARGLTEVAIGQTLGISAETVKRHLKQARQTYNVSKTVQLITRCLHDESITFAAVVDDHLPPQGANRTKPGH